MTATWMTLQGPTTHRPPSISLTILRGETQGSLLFLSLPLSSPSPPLETAPPWDHSLPRRSTPRAQQGCTRTGRLRSSDAPHLPARMEWLRERCPLPPPHLGYTWGVPRERHSLRCWRMCWRELRVGRTLDFKMGPCLRPPHPLLTGGTPPDPLYVCISPSSLITTAELVPWCTWLEGHRGPHSSPAHPPSPLLTFHVSLFPCCPGSYSPSPPLFSPSHPLTWRPPLCCGVCGCACLQP